MMCTVSSAKATTNSSTQDIEELESSVDCSPDARSLTDRPLAVVQLHPSGRNAGTFKRPRTPPPSGPPKPWREQLGEPPRWDDADTADKLAAWLAFHRSKWRIQAERRQYFSRHQSQTSQNASNQDEGDELFSAAKRQRGMARYLTQTRLTLCNSVWQIVEVTQDPGHLGVFIFWILISSNDSTPTLHSVSVVVPRRFYVNLRTPKPNDAGPLYRKVAGGTNPNETGGSSGRLLPRSHSVFHLYEYTVPEEVYAVHAADIAADLARPDVEGAYELNMPPLFRVLMKLGCMCRVDKGALKTHVYPDTSVEEAIFHLDQLRFCSLARHPCLSVNPFRHVFLFHYQLMNLGPVGSRRESVCQDLQCAQCINGCEIQEAVLANSGSVARCADWSSLSLTVPAGSAFRARLNVYRAVDVHFGFPYLEQTALWMLFDHQSLPR